MQLVDLWHWLQTHKPCHCPRLVVVFIFSLAFNSWSLSHTTESASLIFSEKGCVWRFPGWRIWRMMLARRPAVPLFKFNIFFLIVRKYFLMDSSSLWMVRSMLATECELLWGKKKWQKWNLKDENDNLRGCNLEFCLV